MQLCNCLENGTGKIGPSNLPKVFQLEAALKTKIIFKKIIIGAGGNGKVIASNIDDIKKDKVELFGFLDDSKKSSKT